jgi:hypothetical protein
MSGLFYFTFILQLIQEFLMKNSILLAFIFAFFSCTSQDMESLSIGNQAPLADMSMQEISGKKLTLEDLTDEKGLLVIFSCNTCPFVVGNGTKSEGWEGRYNELFTMSEEQGIGMVLVNSNEAKRDQGDNLEDMKAHASAQHYKSKYVLDKDHVLADAFGAMRTPHVYLFNADMELVYMGAIDDNVNRAKEVKETYLLDALEALGDDLPIKRAETPAMGCSIKRK